MKDMTTVAGCSIAHKPCFLHVGGWDLYMDHEIMSLVQDGIQNILASLLDSGRKWSELCTTEKSETDAAKLN